MRPVRFLDILSSGLNDVPASKRVSDVLGSDMCKSQYLYSMQVLGEPGNLQQSS